MNEKNLGYLQDQVKYTGFEEELNEALKEKMAEKKKDFQLTHNAKYGEDSVDVTLNFSKSKESDMYFFNSYHCSLKKEGTDEKLEQTFYINKGQNITLKEAYNLMNGRSVNKDLTNKAGEVYNAWVQMDFKQSDNNGNFKLKHYTENYGFDLEAALGKHPIKELENEAYKQNLMDSLKKGNIQSATFQKDGNEVKLMIAADPQFKKIAVYGGTTEKLDNRVAKTEKQDNKQGQTSNRSNRQKKTASPGDTESGTQEKKSRRKAHSM